MQVVELAFAPFALLGARRLAARSRSQRLQPSEQPAAGGGNGGGSLRLLRQDERRASGAIERSFATAAPVPLGTADDDILLEVFERIDLAVDCGLGQNARWEPRRPR